MSLVSSETEKCAAFASLQVWRVGFEVGGSEWRARSLLLQIADQWLNNRV